VDTAAAESLALVDATALSLRQFLAQAESLMTGTSANFGLTFVSGQPCEGQMQMLADIFRFMASVAIVLQDGTVACSSDSISEGVSAVDWAWFRPMADDPRFVTGDPLVGEISGTWVLPLAAPILDEEGRVAGAIVGAVGLEGFVQLVTGDRQEEDVLVTIATEDHIVIARTQNAEQWVGQPVPDRRGTDDLVGPGRSVARGSDFEDIDRAWGQVELENGWWVYAGVPVEAIFGPTRVAAVRQIGVTLVILLLGMLHAGFSYRRISIALRELASGMPTSEDGGAVEVPEGTPTEFRAVVEQFNSVLRSQHRAEEAERTTRERYQSIFENVVFGLYVSTPDGRFVEVNAALVSMLGYESAAALIEAGPSALYRAPGLRARLVEEALHVPGLESSDVEWVRADGRSISVRLNGKMIRLADGEPGLQMIVQDVSDEKLRENELRHTQ